MNKVFVGSLSWNVDDQELGDHFAQVGNVLEAKVINDRESGRSRGFGFVTFADPACVQEAIDQFDGSELDGRRMKVILAEDKRRGGNDGFSGSR